MKRARAGSFDAGPGPRPVARMRPDDGAEEPPSPPQEELVEPDGSMLFDALMEANGPEEAMAVLMVRT